MADVIVTLKKPLEDVEDRILLPPDRYPAEAIAVEKKRGPQDEYLAYTFVLYSKDGKKGRSFENFSLAEGAEFKIKQLIEACGGAAKGVKFNATKVLGRKFLAEVTNEGYEVDDPENPGKKKKGRKNSIEAYYKLPPEGSPSKENEKEEKSKPSTKEEDEVSFG